jgi:hypothetical protein
MTKFDTYFDSINKFVLYVRAILINANVPELEINVKWCLDNLGSVVVAQEYMYISELIGYATLFNIKSDKDEFLDIQQSYKINDVIELLNTPIPLKPIFNEFYKRDLFTKKIYNLPYKPDDSEYSATSVLYRSVTSDINNIDLTLNIIKSNGIKSFIEYSIVMQHLKKSITTILTDTCAENEMFMLSLLEYHNNLNTKIQTELQYTTPPFSLKGGNVFKLIKRNYILQNEEKTLKHDNLSDWDFTANLPYDNNYHDSEHAFFNNILTNSVDSVYENNKNEINANSDKLFAQTVTLWNYLKTELNLIRTNINVTEINSLLEFKIMCILSGNLMNKYSIEINKDNSDDITDIYGVNGIRCLKLNHTRSITDFKKCLKPKAIKIQQKHRNNSNKNIRILDMELYNIIKYPNRDTGKPILFGFDLIRLGLMYRISFNIGGIILSFNSNAELLDYSLAKPYTVGSYLHGNINTDFNTITYVPLVSTKILTGRILNVHSYNLYWFINDILYIMKTNPRQPKHETRLLRIYQALYILQQTDSVNLKRWLKENSTFDNQKNNSTILIEEFEDTRNRLSTANEFNSYSVSIPMADRDAAINIIALCIKGGNVNVQYFYTIIISIFIILIILLINILYNYKYSCNKQFNIYSNQLTNTL